MNFVFLNTYLRDPQFIFNDNQLERINYIPEYTILNNHSIIGLSEVFGSYHVKKLKQSYKKHNFNMVGAKDSSSGLAIAYNKNNFELISIEFEIFTDGVFPDSLANKGLLYCVLKNLQTQEEYSIIVTHLQSDYKEDKNMSKNTLEKYQLCQLNQLNQIYNFIKLRYIEKYILMGDFNISFDNNDLLFNHMKKLFNIKESTLPKVPTYPEDNRIIDYIINNMYNSKNRTYVLRNRSNDIINSCKSKTLDMLSDHFAITMIC